MKAVIMAGGKGTRIASIAGGMPKPMILVKGKPILEYGVECLREQGMKDIIITISYLGDKIVEYFGDGGGRSPASGEPFGVHISYYFEKEPLGNAGALFEISGLEEDFFLINGDLMFDVDFHRLMEFHKKKKGLATLFTHPNSHPYDSGLIIADREGTVRRWITREEEKPVYYRNRVNAGIHVISPELLRKRPGTDKIDLDRQLLKPLAGTGKLYCYDSPEYVKDMGTPERYDMVCRDVEKNRVKERNLCRRQKAVFLDRDGTINKYVGFLRRAEEFELIDGVPRAVRIINESGYLAIVVTNQPVIARGEVTFQELEMIHNKMETLLAEEGAYVDHIYFCPHHPESGFEGERKEYKTVCDCRKPNPGMLLRAAADYNIDLKESWMIGDSESDILAGKAAGLKTVLLGNERKEADIGAASLLDAVEQMGKRGYIWSV